jgi:alpha-tubulin suppressor-like RCC1 family protein
LVKATVLAAISGVTQSFEGLDGNTNSIGDDETPASAGNVNVGGTVIRVTAGETHSCALLDTGKVRCWGVGIGGRLGYGNTNNVGDVLPPAAAGDVPVF